jgi:hypothetical protein
VRGVAGSNSIKTGTVCSLASRLVKDRESSRFFGAFLCLVRLTKKTKAAVSTIASKIPITIPAMAPPDTFWLFEFLDGGDIEFGCELGLEPSTSQD